MKRQLSHRDLEVVRLVAANGSLTAAARQMYVSQPAISQRLAQLEDRLGTRLFIRRGNGMQPTPAAERLADAALAVDRTLSQALEDVYQLADGRLGQFRFTTQCHTSYRWLSYVIRDMADQRPELAVDVVPEAIEDPYGAVERGEIDAALVYLAGEVSSLESADLFTDEMYAVMRSDHPLAGRRFLNPENFEGEALVLYSGKRHAFVDFVLTPNGVNPGRLRQVKMTEAIVELARAGQGIAVIPGWTWNDLVSRRDLTAVRIFRGGWKRTWRAVFNSQCPADLADSFVASIQRTAEALGADQWRHRLENRGPN